MSKFINIGNADFASVRKDEYVDKSQLIAYFNSVLGTQRKFLWKYNKSAEGAIKQIKDKQYGEALRDWAGEIVLVGINYDKKTKQHECAIERISDNVAINVAINKKSGDKLIAIGENNKQRILEFMATHSDVKSQEIAEVLNLGISRTKVYLSELADAGFIARLGANKDRTYKLKQ